MNQAVRLLLIEDSQDDTELLMRLLRQSGIQAEHTRVQNAADLKACLAPGLWDAVISDYSMPGFNGRQAFDLVRQSGLDLPFFFVSGTLGEEAAVEAMHLGASDYFVKGNLDRFVTALRRGLNQVVKKREARHKEAERHFKEAQLRQSEKMGAVGRLAETTARDFGRIFKRILAEIEVLAGRLQPSSPAWNSAVEIRRYCESGAALTRQLLALGHSQAFDLQPLDLNALVLEFCRLLERLLDGSVIVETRLSLEMPLLSADPGRIEQILINLAANARDAMPKGGILSIETALVDLEGAESGDPSPGRYFLLGVRDTGLGMDKKVLARLFEPFFSTKEEGKGTGLGLSTVYAIVKQSKGHIAVDSWPGQGSYFRIYLPDSGSVAPQEGHRNDGLGKAEAEADPGKA